MFECCGFQWWDAEFLVSAEKVALPICVWQWVWLYQSRWDWDSHLISWIPSCYLQQFGHKFSTQWRTKCSERHHCCHWIKMLSLMLSINLLYHVTNTAQQSLTDGTYSSLFDNLVNCYSDHHVKINQELGEFRRQKIYWSPSPMSHAGSSEGQWLLVPDSFYVPSLLVQYCPIRSQELRTFEPVSARLN